MFPLVQLIFKQRLSQSKIPIKRIHFIAWFGYLITIYNGIRYVHCEHARIQYHPRPSPGRTERFLLSKYISSVVFFIFCVTQRKFNYKPNVSFSFSAGIKGNYYYCNKQYKILKLDI